MNIILLIVVLQFIEQKIDSLKLSVHVLFIIRRIYNLENPVFFAFSLVLMKNSSTFFFLAKSRQFNFYNESALDTFFDKESYSSSS